MERGIGRVGSDSTVGGGIELREGSASLGLWEGGNGMII